MPRRLRLVRSSLFAETFALNRKWVGRTMVLWLRPGEDAALRLGVITSKKVHLRANRRNFARRRLREAYRRLRPYFRGDVDVLLVGRRTILDADWASILDDLLALASKAGIIDAANLAEARKEHGLD